MVEIQGFQISKFEFLCLKLFMVTHIARVWINRVSKVANPARGEGAYYSSCVVEPCMNSACTTEYCTPVTLQKHIIFPRLFLDSAKSTT